MRFPSAVLGVGSKGGGCGVYGKGVDLSSSRSHPSVTAKVPCLPVQHRKSEQGSTFQAPRHFSPRPLLTMWKAGVSLSERRSHQKPWVPSSPGRWVPAAAWRRMCIRVADYIGPPPTPPPLPTPAGLAPPTFSPLSLMPLSLMHAGKIRKDL